MDRHSNPASPVAHVTKIRALIAIPKHQPFSFFLSNPCPSGLIRGQ
jgi:hypothetical protein